MRELNLHSYLSLYLSFIIYLLSHFFILYNFTSSNILTTMRVPIFNSYLYLYISLTIYLHSHFFIYYKLSFYLLQYFHYYAGK